MGTPSRRRRIALALAAGLVLLVALVAFAGPPLAARIVRARLVAGLERELGAEASLDALSLSWSGRLSAKGLALVDRDGARA